jgi:MEKHLA domain
MNSEIAEPNESNSFLCEHASIILASYERLLSVPLLPNQSELNSYEAAKCMYYLPIAVLSHNAAADPIFNYANAKALELFDFSWTEFTQLPSRLSAEVLQQAKREQLLADVREQGYITGYEGIRITKDGLRFIIKNTTIWDLVDSTGKYAGQAACFAEWQFYSDSSIKSLP